MGVDQAVFTYLLLRTMFCGHISRADAIRLEKSQKMPKEHESLRLSCLINATIAQKFGFTLPNNQNLTAMCFTTVAKCNHDYELHKSLIDPNEVNVEIKSLNKTRDEGYWECWYTHSKKTFRAGLNLTVYAAREGKDQSDNVVTIPVLIAIVAVLLLFCVTIIAIVTVLSKSRRSLAKPQNGNTSEEDKDHEMRHAYKTWTTDNNDISNHFESIRDDVEDDTRNIGMQSPSDSIQDFDTRNETHRNETRTTVNNDSSKKYEGLRCDVEENNQYTECKSFNDTTFASNINQSEGTKQLYENTYEYL